MFTSPTASAILAPLLAFLAARWLALAVGGRFPNGRAGTMAALGAITSAALSAMPTIQRLEAGAYWLAADAASAAAMGALGATLGVTLGAAAETRGRVSAGAESATWRRSVALALPLGVGFAIAAIFGLPAGAGGQAVVRAAVAFAATLWLAGDARPAALAIAGVALAIAPFTPPTGAWPPVQPVVALIASIAALAAASGNRKARPDRASASVAKAFQAFVAVALVWSLGAIGLAWPVAGLAAGVAVGMAGRRDRPDAETGGFAAESGMALSFIAGYGVSVSNAASNIPAALAIAASILASTALVAAIAKDGRARLPFAAGAFAAMLAARRAGLASDAAMSGLVLAYLVAVPLSMRASPRRGAETASKRVGTIVGVYPGGDNLGVLSLASALEGRDRAIMAACVATPDGSPGVGVDEAEETLVRCVAAGASADMRVVPNLVASRGVASGLARVAVERGAELVLVGMGDDGNQKPSGAVGELLDAFPGAVVAVKRPGAFQAAKRLVVLAVSGAESSPGFRRAVEAAARIWTGGAKAIESVMIGAPASAMIEAAGGLLQPGRASSVASWRDVPAAIGTPTADEAAFVVLSSRPGSRDWNPGHERLPVVMSSSFPDSPTALWFPPLPSDEATVPEAEAEAVAEARPDDGLPPIVQAAYAAGRVFVDMDEASLVDAIRRLTDSVFPYDRVASGRLASQFSAVARKEPIELAPGILLLHAHARGVALPTLAIGSRPGGWPIIALSSPVRVAVALVSPADSGPEAHLDALTQVATAFRNRGLAERLKA